MSRSTTHAICDANGQSPLECRGAPGADGPDPGSTNQWWATAVTANAAVDSVTLPAGDVVTTGPREMLDDADHQGVTTADTDVEVPIENEPAAGVPGERVPCETTPLRGILL